MSELKSSAPSCAVCLSVQLKRIQQVTNGGTGNSGDEEKSLFNGFASHLKSLSTNLKCCS